MKQDNVILKSKYSYADLHRPVVFIHYLIGYLGLYFVNESKKERQLLPE